MDASGLAGDGRTSLDQLSNAAYNICMRATDYEYGFLSRLAAELRSAIANNEKAAAQMAAERKDDASSTRLAFEVGMLRGDCGTVAAKIEALIEVVQREESRRTVYDRIRDVLDERARYEREDGALDTAREFFEVDLRDKGAVYDLLRVMERAHWSKDCDEYAVVWATFMAHEFCAMMEALMTLLEEAEEEEARSPHPAAHA